jgi:hypothetical protein
MVVKLEFPVPVKVELPVPVKWKLLIPTSPRERKVAETV